MVGELCLKKQKIYLVSHKAMENQVKSLSQLEDINYRELQYSDSQEYRRIQLECLIKHPNNFGTTYDEEFYSTSLSLESVIKAAAKNSFMFGAFTSENKLIGICGFVAEQKLKVRHRGEIVQLFVDPRYARQGIGKKLLVASIDKAFEDNQTEQIILGVVNANENAINLYKQLGFKEYGKLDNYFKSGSEYSAQVFFVLSKSRIVQVFP